MRNPARKKKRPWRVSFLAVLALFFALFNLLRVVEALQSWDLIQQLPLSVPPVYLVVSGGVWAFVGLVLVPGLWFGWHWAWLVTQIAGLLYGLYYWIDRLWLAEPHTMAVRWPFSLLLTILLLLITGGSLWLPEGKRYFGR